MLLAVDALYPEHNALWASIPPLCYVSLCLNTPTQKYAASHTELVLIFSWVYLLFVLINIISPHIILMVFFVCFVPMEN